MEGRMLYDITEARAQLGGIGRSTLYDLVAAGHLRFVKIGRRSFVPHEAIAAYVARLTDETAGDAA